MDNVNGLAGYFHSVARAAGFYDLRPKLRQIILGEDEEVTDEHRHLGHHEDAEQTHRATANERTPLNADGAYDDRSSLDSDGFEPLQNRVTGASQDRIQYLAKQREETRAQLKDGEREPLLVTKVQRDDGTFTEVIIGQSTLPQTIFNSCNTLIGVGILSLPLGIRYAGWVFGISGLIASSLVSKYTAGLLAKCIDVDSSLANFGDIAYVAFGERGRVTVSSLISLELLMAAICLIILFADNLGSLVTTIEPLTWKIIAGFVLGPLQFLPMSWLGYTSFLGIVCNLILIGIALVVGLVKSASPGSLREVATTYAFPSNLRALPLSFGLIMGE